MAEVPTKYGATTPGENEEAGLAVQHAVPHEDEVVASKSWGKTAAFGVIAAGCGLVGLAVAARTGGGAAVGANLRVYLDDDLFS